MAVYTNNRRLLPAEYRMAARFREQYDTTLVASGVSVDLRIIALRIADIARVVSWC